MIAFRLDFDQPVDVAQLNDNLRAQSIGEIWVSKHLHLVAEFLEPIAMAAVGGQDRMYW